MKFFNTFDVASSGMTAQRKMMDITSANIANVNNNRCVKGWSETATPIMSFMDACFYDTEDVAAQWDVLEEAVNEKLAEANED